MRKLTSVFFVTLIAALAVIIWGVVTPGNLNTVTGEIQGWIVTNLGWFYLISATSFVIFCIYLVFSPYGKIRLGKPDERPEYSYLTWFAFLFTAGMGIGLVYWGVAEPLYHYYGAPEAEPETQAAASDSIRLSFFHWGLHPWAIYSVVALALAYFQFRHNAPGIISSAFRPLLGDRVDGWIGTLINFIAVFATIFGVAQSLGFGATQVNGGLSYIFAGINNDLPTQLIIILIFTILYLASATTGLNKGIRYLSWANIALAAVLMLFVLFAGPTTSILNSFTGGIGNYIQNLPDQSFTTYEYTGDRAWLDSWTVFYWAWWIAWAPFVGTFIARVSRGRTIREFITGVLLVPSLFSFVWFAVFATTGIAEDNAQNGGLYELMTSQSDEIALFGLLDTLPFGAITGIIALLLIMSFFITSADSATFVLGMQTTNGSLNPPVSIKFIWGLVISGSAAMLLASGGIGGIQIVMTIAALPFTIIMILMCVSLLKALQTDRTILNKERKLRQDDETGLSRREREQLRKEQEELRKDLTGKE
ncbi:glycine betaine uptake BCCT transporter [Marinococcus halotolerans]|uniref:glycine betaine uptake BCCT transporter n=1 Tax=Marinococcus halotolerans TaxID=301092 RepID=UPI0003B5FA07|nr:BCCT family transporter [Marinococcus halotolerans]